MIRVGASRRTRRGSVWVSLPGWLVLAAVVLFLPEFITWWFIRLAVVVVAWLAHQIAVEVKR